jgi:EAL domain-containing protein (putative c-di-GMP-specific phosphodiesterase class I)/GGDEF domain-containing protein
MQDSGVLSDGTLLYLKVEGLEELNQRLGWATADAILKQVALWLRDLQKNEPEMLLARLGGGSFGLVIPIWQSLSQLEERLNLLWREWKVDHAEAAQLNLAIGDAQMTKTSSVDSLIENALSRAGMFGASSITASTPGRHDNYDLSTWEQLIHDALAQDGLKFELHPVVNRGREVLHQEVSARLSLPNSDVVYSAGQFMPWAVRTHQVVAIDTAILQAAFQHMAEFAEPLALNLDVHSLHDASFIEELKRLTQAHSSLASLLYIEVLAKSAFEHWEIFSQGARLSQSLGIKLGIDNVGHDALDFGRLESLGLHYIKLHPAIVAAESNIAANQVLLGNLLLLARGLGLKVMANGVTTEAALTQLFAFALDGATGPVLKVSQS